MMRVDVALTIKDSETFEDFAEKLRDFVWEVDACGNDGSAEKKKLAEAARQVLKIAVNYI